MHSSDGKLVIVFNGEIYNYRELARHLDAAGWPCRTRSDTEVILNLYQLYGAGCVDHLRGMFAFALWDKRQSALLLARDRVGIKPLYVLRTSTGLAFASEIKAIASAGLSALKVDWRALGRMMRFLVVPQPETIFQDIRKLEPGRVLTCGVNGDVRERTY